MLNLNFTKKAYRPGEMISGEITWNFDQLIKSIELRLTWMRIGPGDPEAMVVEAQQIPCDSPIGRGQFQFTAPAAPYSFMGSLFAIEWIIEASTNPPTTPAMFGLTISPNAEPVVMRPIPIS